MNKQIITQQLTKLGLSEDESEIYIFLLENGPRTPLELSRQTSINRSKIYRLVELMQSKKLIEDTKTAWGQKLVAAPPSNLELLVEHEEEEIKQKKDLLEGLIQDLQQLPGETTVSFQTKSYKGVEGLKQMLWNELKSQEEVLIFGHNAIHTLVGWKFAEKLRQEGVNRKIHFYELTNISVTTDWTEVVELIKTYQHTRQISTKLLKINQFIEIHDDVIKLMNSDSNEPMGLEIINYSLASMFKQIFWHYWELAKQD